jgi:tRNA threonylcarbamoyladenosine biosynthesis protein TsaE
VTASAVTRTTGSPAETRALARRVARLVDPGDVVLLVGELGAGKTEFAKGLADGLGVTEPVVSPTFTLARVYEGRIPMVHADVYRLDRGTEVLDLGLEDQAEEEGVVVVEWGDLAARFLPGEHLEIRLEAGADGPEEQRQVSITPIGRRWAARIAAEFTS